MGFGSLPQKLKDMLKHTNLEDFTFHGLEQMLDHSVELMHWLEGQSNRYDLLADNDVYRALWFLNTAIFNELKRRFQEK